MPQYGALVHSQSQSPRARDFFDIHTLMDGLSINLKAQGDLLKNMFDAKRVPLELLGKISDHRNYHRDDFDSVRDTVKPGFQIQEFDFYVDYVVQAVTGLQPLWEE